MAAPAEHRTARASAAAVAAGEVASQSLLAAAALLLPADPSEPATIVAAGAASALPDVDTVIWVRGPRSAGSVLGVAREILRGEAQLLRLRTLTAWRVRDVRRLPPARLPGPRARAVVRRVALCGAVVELTSRRRGAIAGGRPRHLDTVAAEAGLLRAGGHARAPGFAVGAGGAVLVTGVVGDSPVVLRIAGSEGHGGLHRAAQALSTLTAADFSLAPRLVSHRGDGDSPYSVETRLPGRRPNRLTAKLARQALLACTRLPRRGGPPTSFLQDFACLRRFLPGRAERLAELSDRIRPALERLPSIARHGDLWVGNLLARGQVLTGIVDWDAWHPAGVPAADLLQLAGAAERHAGRRSLGATFSTRPWRRWGGWLQPYWRALDVDPGTVHLGAIAAAWWATEVAGTVERQPDRATDVSWLGDNVDQVLDLLLADLRSR